MARAKGKTRMSLASDNSGEDHKSTSMVSEVTDMTDFNGGVALGEAEQNRTAPSLQSIGENSNTAFATSSRHNPLMGGVPLAFRSSPFQTSTPPKTVSGTSGQADDITTKEESSGKDSAMGDEVGATYDVRQWYQLPPDAMPATDELWQPPQGVDGEATTGSAQAIQKLCQEIETYWNCTIVEAMPMNFRASTPYSLTMLLHMHRLADLSRKDMIGAHAALDAARSSRLPSAVPQSGQARIEWTDTTKIKQDRVRKYAEPRIWENTDGLMLVDVRKACRSINEGKRSQKKAAAEDAMDVTRTRSKKAEKRARYKANKAAKKYEARLQGSGRTAKSVANTRSKSRITGAGIKDQFEDAADLEPQTKGGRWGGSKSDKKDNRQLVRAFQSLCKDKKSEVPESKRNAVDRGFVLPSERLNLAGIPSLGSIVQDQGPAGSEEGQMEGLE